MKLESHDTQEIKMAENFSITFGQLVRALFPISSKQATCFSHSKSDF